MTKLEDKLAKAETAYIDINTELAELKIKMENEAGSYNDTIINHENSLFEIGNCIKLMCKINHPMFDLEKDPINSIESKEISFLRHLYDLTL
jgi:hypothetical protein